ncbi:hypothetical protein ABEB36_008858 [Hypothenemus hampei]|uniref:Peptidase S54 rhomboid domain-containing protein n=1 Tax=Hypothenemus hampei TaxID=57062 RepID=A0ABD1EQF7_HYPHA
MCCILYVFFRCPDDGPRTTNCGGQGCAAPGSDGTTPCPSAARISGATLRSSGGSGVVSERYPLGKDRQSSAITTTTAQHKSSGYHQHHHQQDRYLFNDRTPCSANTPLGTTVRYQSVSANAERYPHGSLDRYHSSGTFSRTPTPSSSERYHTLDKKYHLETVEATSQVACPLDRYTPTERHRRNSKSDVYKIRERSTSSDRNKERTTRDHLQGRATQQQQTAQFDGQYERPATPSILACPPAPPPFGGPSSTTSTSEPPSPAPACDRFVAPPPVSDGESETTDCYAHGAFPSPVAPSAQERFAPLPLPAPSPTEDRPNNKTRYHSSSSDRFYPYNKDNRYHGGGGASPTPNMGGYYQTVNNGEQRFSDGQRYIPPNAHMPVERYVPQPQPQEPFYAPYQGTFERYSKGQFVGSDPYMRRDLTYHYRLPPVQYSQNQFPKIRYSHLGTPSRVKCCQFDTASITMTRPSSGSSSSTSSVASASHASSLQDIQCQNYQSTSIHYQQQPQQEKGTQCPSGSVAATAVAIATNATTRIPVTNIVVPCRHAGNCENSVEYVGASGGRRICATPPPRPQERCEGCIQAAAQQAAKSRVQQPTWRSTTPNSQPSDSNSAPSIQLTPRHVQTARSLTPTTQRSLTPTTVLSSSATEQSTLSSTDETTPPRLKQPTNVFPSTPPNYQVGPQGEVLAAQGLSTLQNTPTGSREGVQRAVSLPPEQGCGQEKGAGRTKKVNYSQSERVPNARDRPALNRSASRREIIKKYIRKEAANFFGVDEENEDEERKRWLDRRKRMASRALGPLKDEYATLSYQTPRSPLNMRHRRAVSEAVPGSSFPSQRLGGRPDVLPGDRDVIDGSGQSGIGLRRKDSVARMTWDGLNYVVTTLTRHRPRPRSRQTSWSRSFPPDVPQNVNDRLPSPEEEAAEALFDQTSGISITETDNTDRTERVRVIEPYDRGRYASGTVPGVGWRRDQDNVILRHPEHRAVIGAQRIPPSTLDNIWDNSDRRQYGMGWIGRFFGRKYRKSVVNDERIQAQLDDMDDQRPFFTYWVTSVQILILCISIICYGFGPFGVDFQAISGQVLVTSLSLQQVDYMEPANFWGGPRAADLIHLGAKFAPCMRVDDKIMQQIERTRKKEKETACCIRNDDSGCVQSSQADCSVRGLRPTKTISTWKKWSNGDTGPGGRISGSVCGLDPKYCDAPASVYPYEWPDDITKWPICRRTNAQISNAVANRRDKGVPKDKLAEHMVCEVIGHPCCIGIHGLCRITTREYCDFVQGHFHEEASLCSQVSCLNDVCGMIPFYFPDVPDQFYRLWTSLFLHAGILQLIITILVQHFLMRDLEKLTGSLRIAIIYMGSGVAGNLASAIFVPYRADVGPAGSQFGLLACLIVEVLNAWPMLRHPNRALFKLLSITFVLFLIGLLPWVDNYAHLFGFVFGFLLSYALLPFVSFGRYDRHKKVFLIWVCLLTALFLFVLLVLLFYIIPVYDCKVCSYFNCLPLTRDFCASQNINFKREEPIV